MRKYIFAVCLFLIVQKALSADLQRGVYNGIDGFFRRSEGVHRGLIVFLHGSVSFYLEKSRSSVSPGALLEGNKQFTEYFKNYDLFLPVCDTGFNWLDTLQAMKIAKGLKSLHTKGKFILAGFSDGATGAFRIMHCNKKMFDAVWMFNPYPQLGWYTRHIDRNGFDGTDIRFLSCKSDKTIPYEFVLCEYLQQRREYDNVGFYLREGGHRFDVYDSADFRQLGGLGKDWYYSVLPVRLKGDTILELAAFRKSVYKSYGMDRLCSGIGYGYNELNLLQKELRRGRVLRLLRTGNGKHLRWRCLSGDRILIEVDAE